MFQRIIYPAPEALPTRHIWKIVDSRSVATPAADVENHILVVPLDDSPESRFVRHHELGHAHLTRGALNERAERLGVRRDCLNACEDLRINGVVADVVDDPEAVASGGLADADIALLAKGIAEKGSLRDASLAIVSSRPLERLHARLCRDLRRRDAGLLRTAASIADEAEALMFEEGPWPTQERCDRVAQLVESRLSERGAVGEDDDDPARIPASIAGVSRFLAEGARQDGRGRGKRSRSSWGELRISTPSLVHRVAGRAARRKRAAGEGMALRYTWRLLSDKAVFQTRSRRAGGSVLIDVSGSMGLKARDIEAIVRAAPGAIVGAYAGSSEVPVGRLWIIAQGGAVTDLAAWNRERSRYKGNIVDGPALEWLARRGEPRVWISDGGVTGVGDRGSTELSREADAIVKRWRIERVESVTDAVKALARARR